MDVAKRKTTPGLTDCIQYRTCCVAHSCPHTATPHTATPHTRGRVLYKMPVDGHDFLEHSHVMGLALAGLCLPNNLGWEPWSAGMGGLAQLKVICDI
jgi:hypothetical protein